MLGYLKVNIVVSYTDMKTVEIDNYKESLENNGGINNILAIIWESIRLFHKNKWNFIDLFFQSIDCVK